MQRGKRNDDRDANAPSGLMNTQLDWIYSVIEASPRCLGETNNGTQNF